VLVLDVPLDEKQRIQLAMVNPVIERRSGAETGEEGCLSVPGVYEDVRRAARVEVRYRDEHGAPQQLVAEGFLARAIQHEVDHLDGILILDRVASPAEVFPRRQR